MLILQWILCCKNLSPQSVMHCKWTMAIILCQAACLLFLLPEVNLQQELHNTFYLLLAHVAAEEKTAPRQVKVLREEALE